MKQLVLILFFLCTICTELSAQKNITSLSPTINIKGVVKEDIREIKAGTPFTLQRFVKLTQYQPSDPNYRQAVLIVNGQQQGVGLNDMYKLEFTPTDPNTFWLAAQINSRLVQYYETKGLQETMRKEMENEANTYLDELEKAGMIYEDAAMEDYVHCIMLSMIPKEFIAERYGMPYIRILKSPNPDILMLSNNCMLVSSGLLTLLDTEDELFGMLARETAHYVLDHAVITVNKNINRANRAAFWSGVADVAGLAIEAALYNKYENYVPGAIFTTNAIVQTLVNYDIYNRMGLDYSKQQEKEADDVAVQFMQFMKKDPSALISAQNKILQYYLEIKDKSVLEKYGIYSSLEERLTRLQKKYPLKETGKDPIYLKRTSGLISFSAAMMEYNRDYIQAMKLAQKNINNKMASSDDYVVMAKCIMKQDNSAESNLKSWEMLKKAESLSEFSNVNISKQKILLLLRDNKQKDAVAEVNQYIQMLNDIKQTPHSETDELWLAKEYHWTTTLMKQLYILINSLKIKGITTRRKFISIITKKISACFPPNMLIFFIFRTNIFQKKRKSFQRALREKIICPLLLYTNSIV